MTQIFESREVTLSYGAEAESLLQELADLDGVETSITLSEYRQILASDSARAKIWYISGKDGDQDADELVALGIFTAAPRPEFRSACLPEHREMSLYLPMIQWADNLAAAAFSGDLTAWAWDQDVCTPYLLLRLNFIAGEDSIGRDGLTCVPYRGSIGAVTAMGDSLKDVPRL